MKNLPFLLWLLLAGCGANEEPSSDNHGYGWEFDAVSRGGLHLRQPKDPGLYTPAETRVDNVEARARTVALCVGVDAPVPPFVIYVPPGELGRGTATGVYFSNPPLIVLSDDRSFEHEVVHYLLEFRDGNTGGEPSGEFSDPAWRCSFEN